MTPPSLQGLPMGHPLHLGSPEIVARQSAACRVRAGARLLLSVTLVAATVALYGGLSMHRSEPKLIAIGIFMVLVAAGACAWMALPKITGCVRERDEIAVLYNEGVAYYRSGVWRSWRWEEISEVTCHAKAPKWDMGGNELGFLLEPLFMFLAPGDAFVGSIDGLRHVLRDFSRRKSREDGRIERHDR